MRDSEAAVDLNTEGPRNGSGAGRNSINGGQTHLDELEAQVKTLTQQNRALQQKYDEARQQSQALLEQTFSLQQKVDSSGAFEKERAEFISAVAHELRTPLTSIKGYIDLVLEGEAGEINELQREFLSVVGANTDKLSGIIGDLLDVSRLEAGRMTFKPVMIDLRNLISQTCESVRPQIQVKGISFNLDLPKRSGGPAALEVSADPERFTQALRSVLANALQLTPQQGAVRLALHPDEKGENAIITIEDEGPGLKAADLAKVFTKFWHPDDPAWREAGGPGLGLAIAKTIIDLHEGTITVANRPDRLGTIFTLTMPLVNRVAGGDDHFWEEQDSPSPERAVLVVSREPNFGRLVQHILGRANFQVIVAGEEEEVVSDSPAWQPDLIIENGLERSNDKSNGQNRSQALRAAPILTVHLSNVERRLLLADALAVLPWPIPEQMLLENIVSAAVGELNSPEMTTFKQNKAVLLVSNSTESLRNLDRILREDGYSKVYRATQESDALTLARRHHPGLLLVDISGGENDVRGPGFFEMLREDPLLGDIPAVVLTRADNIGQAPAPEYRTGPRSDGESGVTSDYYNVIPKPFLQRRFISVAQRLAKGR